MASAQKTFKLVARKDQRDLALNALVPSIAAGDARASATFYDATSGLLFGLLLLILGDTKTAEAVLEEVYAEVKEHAANFDTNRDSLLIWLITISHRRALEHMCTNSADRQFAISVGLTDPNASDRSPSFVISKAAHRRLIGSSLSSLSAKERRMIELAYFSRMTSQAIALKLQQPHETVKTGLQYGISRLWSLFKNQGFYPGLGGNRFH